MMTHQPPAQFSLSLSPIIGGEERRSFQPPLRNTVVTNELAVVEQSARLSALVKGAAPGARLDAKQSEAGFQMLQPALEASQPIIYALLWLVGQVQSSN